MLQAEKLQQAKEIVRSSSQDLWITLVRETAQTFDPVLPLISATDYTWVSALMVTKSGRSIAIVGNHDAEGTRQTGLYDEIISYEEDFRPAFANVLNDVKPRSIALNYSDSNPAADGLTHGLYQYVIQLLQDIGYRGTVDSAEDIVQQLRGQKTPTEIERIRRAVNTAKEIFESAKRFIRVGKSEKDIWQYFQDETSNRGVTPAWLSTQCPGVMVGPSTVPGHNGPSDIQVCLGDVMTIDFGVKQKDYCSDLQRVYYVLEEGETTAPDEVTRAFYTLRDAVERTAAAMRPGMTGNEIDAIARSHVTSAGYPEWRYALGHEVGLKAHDGGVVLGPRWERYKQSIDLPLRVGHVFTLEPGIATPRGYVGLEEMVVVTENGAVFLSRRQQEVFLI